MDPYSEVLRILAEVQRTLGRIEAQFVDVGKLSERVSRLEMWQAWLKGAWAAVVAAYAYIWRGSYGK
jgi:hypothetical protein